MEKPRTTGAQKAKALRRSLWTAITSTNFIGMPALLIFIAAILGITISNLADDFLRDPVFMPLNFLLLLSVAVFFVAVHYFHVIKSIAPVEEYVARSEDGGEVDPGLAREALAASEWFPYRTMSWSLFFYLIGSPLAVFVIQFTYSFSWIQNALLLIGIWSTGMLISMFQFYTTKKRLMPFQASLLSAFPELLYEDPPGKRSVLEVGLRGKFMGAMVLLALVLVILTGVAAYSSSIRGLQTQLGSFYLERLYKESSAISARTSGDYSAQEMGDFLMELHPEKEDTLVMRIDSGEDQSRFIMTEEGRTRELGQGERESIKSLFRIIKRGAGMEIAYGRPTVHQLGPDVYSAVVDRKTYTVAHLLLEGGDLLVLAPISHFKESASNLNTVILIVIVVAGGLAFVYAKYSSEEIRDPLVSIMDSLKAMAGGDLTRHVNVTGRDELGNLGRYLTRAIFGLRRLIGRVGDAAAALDEASESIGQRSGEVTQGSGTQVQAVDEASVSMDQMKKSVHAIAESMHTLATSTEESSASIIEVQATIEEVGQSVDNLSASIEQSTSSIQQMNSSVKEVADNVQHLTRQSEEAMAAMAEMEKMIGQVNESSKQTADISEQVTRDAEQGARSVELTIKGIDRMKTTSEAVSEVITRLGSRAQEIGNILTVIEDVTEETNLLALNAAIIAAQAGEHGRGFSVVADEIKDLAERTSASTKEIAELITAVQEESTKAVERVKDDMSSTNEGVKLSEEAGEALHQIQESVARAMEQTRAIADAAAVQADKTKQMIEFMDGVNSLISQVAQATQEQTKSGDQIMAAAENMEEIAKQVKRATQEQTHGSRQITQAIEHIAEITNYINSSQSEQIKGAEMVSTAVSRIKEAADNNQQRVDLMNQYVENLKKQAEGLRELLGEFNL